MNCSWPCLQSTQRSQRAVYYLAILYIKGKSSVSKVQQQQKCRRSTFSSHWLWLWRLTHSRSEMGQSASKESKSTSTAAEAQPRKRRQPNKVTDGPCAQIFEDLDRCAAEKGVTKHAVRFTRLYCNKCAIFGNAGRNSYIYKISLQRHWYIF